MGPRSPLVRCLAALFSRFASAKRGLTSYGTLALLFALSLSSITGAQSAPLAGSHPFAIKIGGGSWVTITNVQPRPGAATSSVEGKPVSAQLHVNVSAQAVDVPIEGQITPEGQFSANLASLNLTVGGADLALQKVSVTNAQLFAESGALRLPVTLGGATSEPFSNVRIDQSGMRLNDENKVTFANFTPRLGVSGGFPMSDVSAAVEDDQPFPRLTLTGALHLDVPGSSGVGKMTLYDNGVIHLAAQDINVPVGGLVLTAKQAQVEGDGTLRAERGILKAPAAFGGADITVYNIVVAPNGSVSIEGGSFNLPQIKVGGFLLSLRGSLMREGSGFIINAKGTFEAPNLKGVPGKCSGIEVEVTLATTAQNETVLTMQPPAEDVALQQNMQQYGRHPALFAELAGVSLRQASLKLNCQIPVGSTGFVIKTISGSITLSSGSTTIRVSADIETSASVGGTPVVSANPSVQLTTSPFELVLEGSVKLFVFEMASARARITDRSFSVNITIRTAYGTGTIAVNSWVNNTGFHLTGSGRFELGFDKGSIWRKCIKFPFIGEKCVNIPPSNTQLGNIGVEGGQFKNNAWGIKGEACLLGQCIGVYIDSQGNRKIGSVREYVLLEPSQVARARQRWQAAIANGATVAEAKRMADGISINADGDTLITRAVTQTSDLDFILLRTEANPTISLIAPDGTVITQNSLPANVTYSEYVTTTTTVETQASFAVDHAQIGNWTVKLSGTSTATDTYVLDVIGTPAPENINTFNIVNGSGAPSVNLRYTANEPGTVVTLFANSGPITHTVVVTPTNGAPTTIEEPLFDGDEIAQVPAKGDGTLETFPLDVSELPSGTYRVWSEVDDGDNEPTMLYAPEPLVVDHTATWPAVFNTTIKVTPGYGELDLDWSGSPDPDVDDYLLSYTPTVPVEGETIASDAVPTTVITVGEDLDAIISDLDPGIPYRYSVGIYDRETGRTTWSPEQIATPLVAQFGVSANTTKLTVKPGQQASVQLMVNTALNPYPEDVGLYLECKATTALYAHSIYLPLVSAPSGGSASPSAFCKPADDITATFSSMEVVPTTSGVSVTATIAVPAALPAGQYLVPLTVWGGGDEHVVLINLTVSP